MDLVIHRGEAALVLFDQLRLETAVPVPRNIDLDFTILGNQSLAGSAITAVFRGRLLVLVVAQMILVSAVSTVTLVSIWLKAFKSFSVLMLLAASRAKASSSFIFICLSSPYSGLNDEQLHKFNYSIMSDAVAIPDSVQKKDQNLENFKICHTN